MCYLRRQRVRERRLKDALESFKKEVVSVRHVPASFDPRADDGSMVLTMPSSPVMAATSVSLAGSNRCPISQ